MVVVDRTMRKRTAEQHAIIITPFCWRKGGEGGVTGTGVRKLIF